MSRYCHLVYENKRKGEGALRDLSKGPPIHPKMLKIGQNDQNLIIFVFFVNAVPTYLFSYPHLVQQDKIRIKAMTEDP